MQALERLHRGIPDVRGGTGYVVGNSMQNQQNGNAQTQLQVQRQRQQIETQREQIQQLKSQ